MAFAGMETRGRLEGCDIARNMGDGVFIRGGTEPMLVACKCGEGAPYLSGGGGAEGLC